MEELLNQILEELKEMKNNMGHLATRQEVEEAVKETKDSLIEELKRVADTLETIATGEAAATKEKLEDKVEAGDVLLKSLIDGLEDRASRRFDRLEDELREVKSELKEVKTAINEGFRSLGETQQKTVEILNAYLARFEYQDEINKMLNEKIKMQEEQTYFIRRDLKELKDKLEELTGDAS